jgi:hypothetical protein
MKRELLTSLLFMGLAVELAFPGEEVQSHCPDEVSVTNFLPLPPAIAGSGVPSMSGQTHNVWGSGRWSQA